MRELLRDAYHRILAFLAVLLGYYRKDGEPLRCICCGYRTFEDTPTDRMEAWGSWIASEIERKCKKCGTVVGFWAYGHWDRSYLQNGISHWRKKR